MSAAKAPAYQWYPKDYDTDEAVKLMTYEEEGVYRRLLDHQALHGSLPLDPKRIAMLVPKISRSRFLKLWPAMAEKFQAVEGGRRVNRRMQRAQAEYSAFVKAKQTAGSKGGKVAAERRRTSSTATDLLPAKSAAELQPASASAKELRVLR